MLRTTRLITKVLCCINIGLIIGFAWHSSRSTKDFNNNALLHIKTIPCRWPPIILDDIRTNDNTYNFTLCVRLLPYASGNDSIITYPIQSLFRNMESGKWVSFKEIGSYNRSIWRLAIYPNVWRTYPQDVPTKKVIKAIKSGSPVSVVSWAL